MTTPPPEQYGTFGPPPPQFAVPDNSYAQAIPPMPQQAPDPQWGLAVPQQVQGAPDLLSRLGAASQGQFTQSELVAAERAIKVFEALGPVFDVVRRARELAAETRELLRPVLQQARETVVDASRRAVTATRTAAVTASKRTAAENGRAVLNGMANMGQAALQTGRQMYDGVSRWARGMRSTGAHRAESTRSAFALFRKDPGVAQTNLHGKDVNSLAGRAFDVEYAQSPEERSEALERLYQTVKSLPLEEGAGRHRGSGDLSPSEAAGLRARVIAVESAQTPEARTEALDHLYDAAANVIAPPGNGSHRRGPDAQNLATWTTGVQPPAGSPRPEQTNAQGAAPKTGGQQQAPGQGQGFTK
ncbi:hypothetical protein EV646_104144 [Kribbella antiqua]|uniref:Uncharacterized protein n=1 Tax=Kribbella antiqua TaxID=2512217 RepID=A0A4R2ITB4_9ACTN|nr:hypothetical protein [Kribbella antiqua]TCO48327.1 hypothetical protein EV646_104144 [Kribbella antiqua]